jgi:hypothetical protein
MQAEYCQGSSATPKKDALQPSSDSSTAMLGLSLSNNPCSDCEDRLRAFNLGANPAEVRGSLLRLFHKLRWTSYQLHTSSFACAAREVTSHILGCPLRKDSQVSTQQAGAPHTVLMRLPALSAIVVSDWPCSGTFSSLCRDVGTEDVSQNRLARALAAEFS